MGCSRTTSAHVPHGPVIRHGELHLWPRKVRVRELGDWSRSKMSVCNPNSVLFSLYVAPHLFTMLPPLPPKADRADLPKADSVPVVLSPNQCLVSVDRVTKRDHSCVPSVSSWRIPSLFRVQLPSSSLPIQWQLPSLAFFNMFFWELRGEEPTLRSEVKPWVQFSSHKSFVLGTDCLLGCCACSMKGLFTLVHQMPYHVCAHCLHAQSFVLTNPKPLCYPLMLFHLLLCLIIPRKWEKKKKRSQSINVQWL